MGFFDFIGKVVFIALILFGILYFTNGLDFLSGKISLDPEAIRASPYVNKIVYDDIEIRQFTASVTKGCPSGDKECQLNKVFRHVVENYNYYSDPVGKELIQSPYETREVEGGDCEDFSILMNSMLESIGIKTYLVLTDDHAYSLACGIDPGKLRDYVEESIIKVYATDSEFSRDNDIVYDDGDIYIRETYNLDFVVDSFTTYYFGGDGSEITDPFLSEKLDYSITFSSPVDMYVVSGRGEYEKLAKSETFSAYSECTELGALSVDDECTIGTYGGIAISNDNLERVHVQMKLDVYMKYNPQEFLKDITITSYSINGASCVVLDGTSGKFGYPGLNPAELKGKKVAVDPKTKEIIYLE